MKTIDAKSLKQRLDQESIPVVNTLPQEYFQKKHIPNSVNIPQDADDFTQRVEQLAGDKSQPVVVYCASQQCDSSTKGGQRLENSGFTNVIDFEGGVEAWEQENLPVEAGA